VRSRAAASVLTRAGFNDVHSMEGGIHAWKGLVAKGVPEAGMAYFPPGAKPEELITLAWILEGGTKKFYAAVPGSEKKKEFADFFRQLAGDEEKHQSALWNLYKKVSGKDADSGFPGSVISVDPGEEFMEGGMRVKEALAWMEGKTLREIVELALSLEVNASDLYIKMERRVADRQARETFQVLSNQEKRHLERLTELFEKI
jgi:rubrerythrin